MDKISVDKFLFEIEHLAFTTEDKQLKLWTDSYIDEICKDRGLCRECFTEPQEAILDGYLVSGCNCPWKQQRTPYKAS